jgi:PPE-repeat protein
VSVAALTDLLVTMPARRLTFTLADAVNRRRLTRAARPARPLRAPPPRGPFASGLIESGPVASGLNTDELNTDELGVGGLGVSGLGASGLGASGLGASGLGASGLGASGLGASGLAADGLAGALEPLLQARVRLVSAALRQVDSRRWRSPYLAHLAAEHRSIARIAEADRLLCQAVNYLEIYLDEHTKEPG